MMPEVDFIREIAAVPIAGMAMYFMYRLASNHMNRLANAIDRLRDFLERKLQ